MDKKNDSEKVVENPGMGELSKRSTSQLCLWRSQFRFSTSFLLRFNQGRRQDFSKVVSKIFVPHARIARLIIFTYFW